MSYIPIFPFCLWTSHAQYLWVSDSLIYAEFPYIDMHWIWLLSHANLPHVYVIARTAEGTWGIKEGFFLPHKMKIKQT